MSLYPALTTHSVRQAATWLSQGQLLAYPTESVWGLGCDPFNQAAVMRLLTIKQRPMDKGMIVVTDSAERLLPLLAHLTPHQRHSILDSWTIAPDSAHKQAHTWLLPLPQALNIPIPTWITGAHHSVAVRVIAHPLIQKLCAQMLSTHNPYGFIVSTSCNPSGQPPALSLQQAQAYFMNNNINKDSSNAPAEAVVYLQGETLGYQLPSQIHDALTAKVIR